MMRASTLVTSPANAEKDVQNGRLSKIAVVRQMHAAGALYATMLHSSGDSFPVL